MDTNKMGKFEIYQDIVAEKLDEMADLAEYWKRHRSEGRHPSGIRAAMLHLTSEIQGALMMEALKRKPDAPKE